MDKIPLPAHKMDGKNLRETKKKKKNKTNKLFLLLGM